MITKTFIFFFLPFFALFFSLALSHKSLKIYHAGWLMTLFYFTAITEGIVFIYKNKIPAFAKPFIKNPYATGKYQLLQSNLAFNKVYFILIAVLIIAGWIILKKKK